jgi:hypothetical protein
MQKPKKGLLKAVIKGNLRILKPADKETRALRKAEKAYKKSIEDEFAVKMKKGGSTDSKWIQKATKSIKRRGTEGKCTPITKPGCTGRAKALAKTFKKMAKKK